MAGGALILGVVLLLADMKPAMRVPHLRHRRQQHARPEGILMVYLGLAGIALLTTLIPAGTLSTRQEVSYEIVAERSVSATWVGQYLVGEPHREEVVIENPSPLPLLVVFAAEDPYLTYQPSSALIPGKHQRSFTVTVANPNVGRHQSLLHTGIYLPLLPPALVVGLARMNMAMAALATATVPALVILGIALLDARTRSAIHRLRLRLTVKLMD